MKTAAILKFDCPYEYWQPMLSLDVGGNEQFTYAKAGDGMGMLSQSVGGFALTTKDQLSLEYQVRNIKDRYGTPLQVADGAEYPLFITVVEAQFDAFGAVVAWKHTLKRQARLVKATGG